MDATDRHTVFRAPSVVRAAIPLLYTAQHDSRCTVEITASALVGVFRSAIDKEHPVSP